MLRTCVTLYLSPLPLREIDVPFPLLQAGTSSSRLSDSQFSWVGIPKCGVLRVESEVIIIS